MRRERVGLKRFEGDIEALKGVIDGIDTIYFSSKGSYDPEAKAFIPNIQEACFRALDGWQCIAIAHNEDGTCRLIFQGYRHDEMLNKRLAHSQIFIALDPEPYAGRSSKGVIFVIEDFVKGETN